MSKSIVYWYVLEFHWQEQFPVAAGLEQVKLPFTYNASVSANETLGIYRLLSATFNPKMESLVRLVLGPKVKVTVYTDMDELLDYVNLDCVQQLSLITTGELRSVTREQIHRQLFI